MTESHNWRPELTLAEAAVRAAGELLRRGMSARMEVLSAAGRDIKLRADKDAEEAIFEVLAGGPFPILSEEAGGAEPTQHPDPVWIVDPLDGTFNYSRGLDLCCSSVGLWWAGRPILGAISRFTAGEIYTGIAGESAHVNGERIRTSALKEASQAVLATGLPIHADYSDSATSKLATRIQAFKKIRMFGTAALSLAFVAAGKVDVYHEEGIMIWDVAAGLAIVLGAGGTIEVLGEGPLSRTPLSISAGSARELLVATVAG